MGEAKLGEVRERSFEAERAGAGVALLSPQGSRRIVSSRRRERHERSGWL
jgi:hypothetical protein